MTDIQLTCFCTVATNLNFTESAKLLFISQATLSRNISALESELGFRLLERTNKTVALTPAGKTFFEGVTRTQEELQSVIRQAKDIASGLTGTLRLGFLDGQLLDRRMHHAVSRFTRCYPNIRLTLMRGGFRVLTGAIYEDKLDLIETLSFEVHNLPGCRSFRVGPAESYLVLPDYHALAKKPDLKLSDFRDELFICPSPRDSRLALEHLRNNCLEAGFTPKVMEVEDMATQLLLVETGRGCAMANRYHMMCNSPVLARLRVPELMDHELTAAHHEKNTNPALPLFVKILREVIDEDETRLAEGRPAL